MAEQQIAFGAAIMLLTASPARADPCEGRLPSRPGQQFGGTVRYVGDGDGFCVGNSADPNTWIEVRLADFDAPELHSPDGRRSKALLEQVAFGQTVSCEARRGRSDRVIVYDLLRPYQFSEPEDSLSRDHYGLPRRKMSIAVAKRGAPITKSASACGQSSDRPIPFRNTPRITSM